MGCATLEKLYNLDADAPSDRGDSVFEEQFTDLGESREDWYTLVKCDPNYLVHYHDGEVVTLSTDMVKMKKEIEKWEGKDGWIRFMNFMSEVRAALDSEVWFWS